MTLNEYLKKKKITPDEFAKAVGATGDAVRKWLRGERFPLRYIGAIVDETKGAVTANSFSVRTREDCQ